MKVSFRVGDRWRWPCGLLLAMVLGGLVGSLAWALTNRATSKEVSADSGGASGNDSANARALNPEQGVGKKFHEPHSIGKRLRRPRGVIRPYRGVVMNRPTRPAKTLRGSQSES